MSDRYMWQSLMELCCRKGRTAVALQVCRLVSCISRPCTAYSWSDGPVMAGQRIICDGAQYAWGVVVLFQECATACDFV